MLPKFIYDVIAKWKITPWQPPLPTLDDHLKHIGGGVLVAAIFMAFGVDPVVAVCFSTIIFATVESVTTVLDHNIHDSMFDLTQYLFQWVLLATYGSLSFGLVAMVIWLILYFAQLLGAFGADN